MWKDTAKRQDQFNLNYKSVKKNLMDITLALQVETTFQLDLNEIQPSL